MAAKTVSPRLSRCLLLRPADRIHVSFVAPRGGNETSPRRQRLILAGPGSSVSPAANPCDLLRVAPPALDQGVVEHR
jgi:hypothetical protein